MAGGTAVGPLSRRPSLQRSVVEANLAFGVTAQPRRGVEHGLLTGVADDASVVVSETEHDPREVVMEQVCLVIPVQPGRASDAREFMRELEASRKDEYARSEERIAITKEVWFLANVAGGDAMVAYMETNDFANALRLFSQSQDEFDVWFKRRMAEATIPLRWRCPSSSRAIAPSRPSRRPRH
jgi:hypothetical protein